MAHKIITENQYDAQVVKIILNDPPGNVLDSAMITELQVALNGLASQPNVKLIHFTGTGDHFCFGASVEEHIRENAPAMLKGFHQLFYTLMDLAIPTVASLSGQCLGGGMELAIMCNVLFADETTRLGQPEIVLGVFAPPASAILPMKIGQTAADDILLTGASITPSRAAQIGLINEVYADKAAMETGVNGWIEKTILPKSASSLRHAVKAARRQFNAILREALPALEKTYNDELMTTHDANEGIASFLEKRNPVWEDR